MTKSPTILIAEDEELSRALLGGILEAQGYTVCYATDAGDAIEKLGTHHVDMAFVDINMAPKGGFDFMRYLNQNNITLPVVIITADQSTDLLNETQKHGVRYLLRKPLEPSKILSLTEKIMRVKPMP